MERRKELATFLKTRRTQLTPEELGIPLTTRRRTPGLRREEVAQRAAVGLTWYTWLEQGRNISVSPQVLKGVSRALQLSTTEQQHLFSLAQLPLPGDIETLLYDVDPKLQTIVQGFGQLPASLINQKWDIIAFNDAVENLCANVKNKEQPNILYNMFVDPEARKRIINWETQAKSAIGLFRAETSKFIGAEWYLELIANLTAQSPEFREWWPNQTICQAMNIPKHYNHPEVGELSITTTMLNVQESPNLKLVVNTPIDDASHKKLALLAASHR